MAGAAETARGTVVVRVLCGASPVSSASVTGGGLRAETSSRGKARLDLPAGEHEIAIERLGFEPTAVVVVVTAGHEVTITVQLRAVRFEDSVVVVGATRSGTVVEDQPIRVEAVPGEEIEENLTIAPGSLLTLLNELAGVQLQTTAPTLGGTRLRLRGLGGRHTMVLSDELPLGGQVADAFDLLQVPPLDLAQVELIKGAASALYGSSALGGVVNLVSRRPGSEPEVLVNQTSHSGTDAVGFGSGRLAGGWGFTLLASAHNQRQEDLDGDGWADLAGYRRGTLRPRLFWEDDAGQSFFATLGAMMEEREGGTVGDACTPAGEPFSDRLRTDWLDGGLVGRFLVGQELLLGVHASFARTAGERLLGETLEHTQRRSGFAELSLAGTARGHTWVVGGAVQDDRLHSQDLRWLEYRHTTPAVFAQDEWAIARTVSLAASGRLDLSNAYGTFFNPKVSLLVRPGSGTSVRLSAGSGFALPEPFAERTDEVGLSRLRPLRDLEPERADTVALDVGYSSGAFELDGSVFAARIGDALMVRQPQDAPGELEVFNAPGPTRSFGAELLCRYSQGPLHVIGTYTFVDATESDPEEEERREVPLTPRHAAELALILEDEARGRIGAELAFTGAQRLEDNPYRSVSPSYRELNLLGELVIGEARVFANAVNLTGVRQTDFNPLLLPERASDGRWTTGVWAPLAGRVFNVGVRIEL
jgi:outer membrane receptor for ferrienterochelin and colicins